MSAEPAIALASAIQSGSIKRDPSPSHDLNPPTAATNIQPAPLSPTHSSDSISSSLVDHPVAQRRPRRTTFPPLPDFRFEQSYLASLKNADSTSQVAYITIRDQLILPLVQGTLWSLALHGWRYWNRGVKFRGESIGSRVRKWWWEVNKWELPTIDTKDEGFAEKVEDFYVEQFGSAVGD